MKLTKNEELRLLGQFSSAVDIKPVTFIAIEENIISSFEDMLPKFCCSKELKKISKQELPIKLARNNAIERDMQLELDLSWKMHCQVQAETLEQEIAVENALDEVSSLKHRVSLARYTLEKSLLRQIDYSNCSNQQELEQDLQLLTRNAVPATKYDLLLQLLQPKPPAKAIIQWLRLCTLENKCNRIKFHFQNSNLQGALTEITRTRSYNPNNFPAWLVFEVEHSLEIWPEQVTIAEHLIVNNGDIVQLNMGKGKTRYVYWNNVNMSILQC